MDLIDDPKVVITKDDLSKAFKNKIKKEFQIELEDFTLNVPTKGKNKGNLLLVLRNGNTLGEE